MAKTGQLAGFVQVGLDDSGAKSTSDAKRGNVPHIYDKVGAPVVRVVP